VNQNLLDQARNLINKSTFPENVSSNQTARYLYYIGRIKSIQLEYSDAQAKLTLALRKAPESTAKDFKTQV
jgi:26S proteasome regulatory subunit N3